MAKYRTTFHRIRSVGGRREIVEVPRGRYVSSSNSEEGGGGGGGGPPAVDDITTEAGITLTTEAGDDLTVE